MERCAQRVRGATKFSQTCKALDDQIGRGDRDGLHVYRVPTVDKEVMLANDREMGLNFVESLLEGLKHNGDGWADDDVAFISSWGFNLGEIEVPILLYHGELDNTVPFAHGKWLAKHLRQDKLTKHLLPGQGHISIFAAYRDSMIDQLLEIRNL